MENQIIIEVPEIKNSCFIAMPFNPLFKIEYEDIIQPAVIELGLECVRGDEIYSQQRIMDDIWASIRSCRLVVAELTTRNPNVLYEIGLAHALGKPVIILTRNADDVPFDLKDLRYLFYDINDPYWGENLKKGLQNLVNKVLENPEIGTYLQGITRTETQEFPTIKKVIKKQNVKPSFDLSGTWKTIFYNGGLALKHELVLTLTQDKNQLSGIGTVTFMDGDKLTVIQEIFHGSISDSLVNLAGVNYSYLARGSSSNYHLDSFEMKIIDDNKMVSNHVDEYGTTNQNLLFIKE